jgi:triosephosphate isomerase
MALGADGTGSTSGILGADDPLAAARAFIAAARSGWDAAHSTKPRLDHQPLDPIQSGSRHGGEPQ